MLKKNVAFIRNVLNRAGNLNQRKTPWPPHSEPTWEDREKRLSQIRTRLERATPAPWNAEPHTHHASGCRCLSCYDDPTGWFVDHPHTQDCDEYVASLGNEGNGWEPKNEFGRMRGSCDEGPFLNFDDAEFAAHSRQDIPWLLERLAEAERALDELACGYSYSEVVNMPLSPSTIEALRKQLASGDYPRRQVKLNARKGDVAQ